MVPSGAPPPVRGAQAVNPSALLRSNSGLLGGQIPSQTAFPSLLSPHSQYGNINLLGNLSNVSSLLGGGSNASIGVNQALGSVPQPAGSNHGLSGSGNIHRGGIESEPFSGIGNGVGFSASPMPFNSSNTLSSNSSGINVSLTGSGVAQFQNSSNQLTQDPHHTQQLDVQNFARIQQGPDPSNTMQIQSPHMLASRGMQQFSVQNSVGLGASPQQQLNSLRALSGDQSAPSLTSLRGLVPVKMEPQMVADQLTNLRNMGPVKLEQQQQQTMGPGPVKLEQQQHQQQQQQLAALRSIANIKSEMENSDQSLFLQQQQQQLLQMSRQPSQKMQLQAAAQMSLLQQQRLLQQQQQQKQQMLKTLPLQQTQLQQAMQQFQQHNLPLRSTVKPILYEPGMCARRLTQYMSQQQHRPADNNIEFWRNFIAEYFTPNAKKRWCVSLYGNGRQTTGVFPQDIWHCEICNIKPGRGFETTVEVLPRLCKIKYDSGTLEELLYVDMPREYQTASGHIVLDYGKAIQESVFEQLRVVRDGQLRVVFSMDLKICSWEFCARRHEELIPRRLILSQISQLGAVAQKYQASTQNGSPEPSVQELQSNCNMFVATARHLVKAMEVPLVNDLGYTKRYVRCLQISEVVNCMKDLIDYSRQTQTGPIASLNNFPRQTAGSDITSQEQQQKQARSQDGEGHMQTSATQQFAQGNGMSGPTSSMNTSSTSTFTTASGITNLVHQNSMNTRNARQDEPLNNGSGGPFGSSIQMSSVGSSSSIQQQQSHANPSSPFPTTAPAPNPLAQSSTAPTAHSSSANSSANVQPPQASHSGEIDPDDSQSSVQQIIQEIMMSSQQNARGNFLGVRTPGNEMKSLNAMNMQTGCLPLRGTNLVGNGTPNGTSINGAGFGNMGGINPISGVTFGGVGPTMSRNNSFQTLNGRISMHPLSQQDPNLNHHQDTGNRMLNGMGSMNNFNNLQFDWKSSP